MKPVYLLIISILLTSCVKNGIAPASAKTPAVTVKKADSVKVSSTNTAANDDVDYNGTTGTAILQVTCTGCTAIAIINNVGTPFAFNAQGVGELKYTPTTGTSVYIAVCPGSVKAMKVDIFDAAHNSLFSYTGTTGNWSNMYVVK